MTCWAIVWSCPNKKEKSVEGITKAGKVTLHWNSTRRRIIDEFFCMQHRTSGEVCMMVSHHPLEIFDRYCLSQKRFIATRTRADYSSPEKWTNCREKCKCKLNISVFILQEKRGGLRLSRSIMRRLVEFQLSGSNGHSRVSTRCNKKRMKNVNLFIFIRFCFAFYCP